MLAKECFACVLLGYAIAMAGIVSFMIGVDKIMSASMCGLGRLVQRQWRRHGQRLNLDRPCCFGGAAQGQRRFRLNEA